MTFDTLFGLESPILALRRALASGQLPGAYLFVGPPGVGKTSLALAFAGAAACLDPRAEPFDACGRCDSCRRAAAGAQSEIALIAPAGDQTQIWQFWDRDGRPPGALQHSLPFAPVLGRRRVYIVERADTLTEQAANSLLKALEEPPPYAVFVLLAPHAARLLPTILSRAQVLRLLPAPVDGLATYLSNRFGLDMARARVVAAFSEGRTGAAVRLADSPAAEGEMQRALEFAESIAQATPLRALRVAEGIRKTATSLKHLGDEAPDAAAHAASTRADAPSATAPAAEGDGESAPRERVGRRQLGLMLDLMAAYYRDLLAMRLGGPDAAIVHAGDRERLAAVAVRCPPQRWIACLDALMSARRRVDQNVSVQLLTDWLATRLVLESQP